MVGMKSGMKRFRPHRVAAKCSPVASRQREIHCVNSLPGALFLEGRRYMSHIKAGLLTSFRLQTPSHRFPANGLNFVRGCSRSGNNEQVHASLRLIATSRCLSAESSKNVQVTAVDSLSERLKGTHSCGTVGDFHPHSLFIAAKRTLNHCIVTKILVELEGVEPSSAQGNHTLSTRLSWTSFSCRDKTQATNHGLIS